MGFCDKFLHLVLHGTTGAYTIRLNINDLDAAVAAVGAAFGIGFFS